MFILSLIAIVGLLSMRLIQDNNMKRKDCNALTTSYAVAEYRSYLQGCYIHEYGKTYTYQEWNRIRNP